MKHTTRRSVIAASVLSMFAASATYADPKPVPPGLLKKTVSPTPTGAVGVSRTSTPTPRPTLPPSEWTPTPTSTAFSSATSTRTMTRTPTRTPTPRPTSTSGAHASPTTSYTQPNPTAAASYDYTTERYELVDRINEERRKVGARLLTIDERAMAAAQWRAEDANTRRYTGHFSPGGVCYLSTCWSDTFTIGDVLKAAGINWFTFGENWWQSGAYTTELDAVANQVFLGSPGHKANMLNPAWTHVGVGVAVAHWLNGLNVIEAFYHL